MSITLNATLQTAQDGISHHIITEIKRVEENEIPFLGQYLTTNTTDEQKPNCITHSTGRICACYKYGTDNINYVYSDIAREIFTSVTLNDTGDLGLGGAVTIDDCSIVELADNTIGLVFICHDGGNYYIRQSILSLVGVVSSNAGIASYPIATYPEIRCPFCILMTSNDYLLVYLVSNTSNEWTIYKRTCNDFSSWSAETSIVPTGISTEEKHNVSLLEIDTNDVFIFFDYENTTNITNIYYSISADYGANWGAAVAVTAYDTTNLIARHPIAIQQATSEMHIVFNELYPYNVTFEFYDLTGVDADAKGYYDIIYDNSQYIYIIPYNNGVPHGHLIKYDTEADFDDAGSYTVFDLETNFDANAKRFDSGLLVGDYLYLVAYSIFSGYIVQYDTSKDFSLSSSYRIFNVTTVDAGAAGYTHIIYDGSRYIYLIPLLNASGYHGHVARYDTQGDFTSTESWTVTDITSVYSDAKGFFRACFDGTYIYLIRHLTSSKTIIRYDTRLDFTSNLAYQYFNLQNIDTTAYGYVAGVYDNRRYIYFVPNLRDTTYHGKVIRLDTKGDFNEYSSWAIFDMSILDSNLVGYLNATFDGRYIYFIPYRNDNPDFHGNIVRFDTNGDFLNTSMWKYANLEDLNASAVGFLAGCYDDNQWIYLAPYENNGGKHGLLTRINKNRYFNDINKSLYKKNLWGGASWALYAGLTNSYSVYDITAVDADAKGYWGICYDGSRYVYLSPYNNGGYHGHVARYDTQGDFDAAGSWTIYDITAVDADAKGYTGICYDGSRYVYLSPHNNGAIHGHVARYDTQGDFDAAGSWTVYDITAVDADAKGYSGICYDGSRYVYLSPNENGGYHGHVARYDTQGDFDATGSWTIYDITAVDADAKGYWGICYDGSRYVYLSPYYNGAYHGHVARYDTEGDFDAAGSWTIYDITAVDADAKGYWGICYDGKYVYLSPFSNGAVHGHVARYDTEGDFDAAGSWTIYDITAVDADAKGYTGICYDGSRYVYLSPNENGGYHGHVARYDTQGDFDAAGSWTIYDITAVDADAKGYRGICYDGKYVYLSPYYNGAYHGHVARYDTQEIFSAIAPEFIKDDYNRDTVVCLEPTTNNFCIFWTKNDDSVYSIKWEKEFDTFDFSPYLATDQDIVIERSIDGQPARLTFNLASGHLFDQDNINSLYQGYIKKGTKITCRLGELISSTEYWQTQGTYYVKSKGITYRKGVMPIMMVHCEDIQSILEDMELISTKQYDEEYPEAIIRDVLFSKGSIAWENISINNMDDRNYLYSAWTNEKILNIVRSICDRFGYFLRVDADNIFKIKKITGDASTDHTYSDKTIIIDYSPNNDYSDYVNKIIVQSEERLFRQVLYPEKEIQIVHGTIGWWQGTQEIKIPYSDDYSLECTGAYPIIKYLQSNFLFKADPLRWELTADASNTFCTLKIMATNRINELIAALLIVLGSNFIPVIGGAISAAGFLEIFNILATVSNWDATIRAQPIGYVKAAVEGIANDTEFQNKIDRIVVRTIQEPLCYTADQCQIVAEHEMLVTRLQRQRIIVNKIGHLQDEEGDIIQIVHPISNENIKLYVTNLIRRVRIPSKTDQSGGIFDTIEGWKL